jgi:hypothetical protein
MMLLTLVLLTLNASQAEIKVDGARVDVNTDKERDQFFYRRMSNRAVKPKNEKTVVLPELSAEEKGILPELCRRPDPAVIGSTKVLGEAEFYFRPFPKSDRLTFAVASRNYVLDMKTGAKQPLPGNYDAFPSPDEKLVVVANMLHATFYANDMALPILTDSSMQGYYQSVGVLEDGSYRVILDTGHGFKLKDYALDESGKVSEKYEVPKRLCSNQPNLSLPMLSKDGKKISALNFETQQTVIFTVDSNSGDCTVYKKLGVGTGKVDFSPDGKSVTYAQEAVSDYLNGYGDPAYWMRKPNKEMVSNAYVQNLETGEVKALTHFMDSNVLYPAYNAKGEIIARKYAPNGTEFIKLDPNLAERPASAANISDMYTCSKLPRDLLAALGLGSLFLRYCGQNAQRWSPQSLVLLGRDLDPSQCRLLAQHWGKATVKTDLPFLKVSLEHTKLDPSALNELSASDLLAACGAQPSTN